MRVRSALCGHITQLGFCKAIAFNDNVPTSRCWGSIRADPVQAATMPAEHAWELPRQRKVRGATQHAALAVSSTTGRLVSSMGLHACSGFSFVPALGISTGALAQHGRQCVQTSLMAGARKLGDTVGSFASLVSVMMQRLSPIASNCMLNAGYSACRHAVLNYASPSATSGLKGQQHHVEHLSQNMHDLGLPSAAVAQHVRMRTGHPFLGAPHLRVLMQSWQTFQTSKQYMQYLEHTATVVLLVPLLVIACLRLLGLRRRQAPLRPPLLQRAAHRLRRLLSFRHAGPRQLRARRILPILYLQGRLVQLHLLAMLQSFIGALKGGGDKPGGLQNAQKLRSYYELAKASEVQGAGRGHRTTLEQHGSLHFANMPASQQSMSAKQASAWQPAAWAPASLRGGGLCIASCMHGEVALASS